MNSVKAHPLVRRLMIMSLINESWIQGRRSRRHSSWTYDDDHLPERWGEWCAAISTVLDGYLLMICDDIHLLVWIGGWRDVHHIVNSSVNGTPYHTIFQNEKANFCSKTRRSCIFLEFTYSRKKRKNGIPKRECKFLPQDRPPKRIAFFWNLRLEATFFFCGICTGKRHFLLCYLPILSYA